MGLVNFFQGIALMFNSFVNPIALSHIGWKYYIVYCVILLLLLVIIFLFFPETRGYSLEELAQVFESDEPVWKRKRNTGHYIADEDTKPEKEAQVVSIEVA